HHIDSIIRHPYFICVDGFHVFFSRRGCLIFKGIDVLDGEAQYIPIPYGILDQIMMQTLIEYICSTSSILALIIVKSRCTSEAEVLGILEMPADHPVHITKLLAVSIVNEKKEFILVILLL